MFVLLQSDTLQRFCFNIVYQILISVTESLSQPILHVHLARAPLLYVLLASQVEMADSLGAISAISLHSCQPFWWPPICGRYFCVSCLMLRQLSTRALQMRLGYLKNITENAVGSKGTYWDVLVLQFTHTLYPEVEKMLCGLHFVLTSLLMQARLM